MLKFNKTLFLLILVGAFSTFAIFPYFYEDNQFLIGFDSGSYSLESIKYLYSSDKIIESISLWNEPALFVTMLPLVHLTSSIKLSFIAIMWVYLFSLALFVFAITRRLTKNEAVSYIAAILFLTSVMQLNSIYQFFLKQMVSTILLMSFIFILTKFNEKAIPDKRKFVLLLIISIGIIFSHRAISLLWLITIIILLAYEIRLRNYKEAKLFSLLAIAALVISLPYQLIIVKEQIIIATDFVTNSITSLLSGSLLRENVGDSLTKGVKTVNPLVDYIFYAKIIPLFGLLGLVISIKSKLYKKFPEIFILSIILVLFCLMKFTFSNRFILNLDVFLILLSALALINILSIPKKRLKIMFVFLLITLMITLSFNILSAKNSYIKQNLDGVEFISNNVTKNNSIIFAPDYIQVTLAQMGYYGAQYEDNLQINLSDGSYDWQALQKSDNFLIEGYNNLSIIEEYNLSNKEVYVIFGEWDVAHKLPRANSEQPINLTGWDESEYYERIYSGNKEIYRIYKLKK